VRPPEPNTVTVNVGGSALDRNVVTDSLHYLVYEPRTPSSGPGWRARSFQPSVFKRISRRRKPCCDVGKVVRRSCSVLVIRTGGTAIFKQYLYPLVILWCVHFKQN